ncbi:MAG: class I SAM-dependent methyltransferase [Gammaproteobacteria bacterium]
MDSIQLIAPTLIAQLKPCLELGQGDTENLPFADQSFDAVINIESSHCYPRFSSLPRRSGTRAAPGRAFPIRRFPTPRRYCRRGGGTGQRADADAFAE